LSRELKSSEAKPQYTDEDSVVALSGLSTSDLTAMVSSPGTITTLFLRFDGAKETGKIQKSDFLRFYEACAAFKDTAMVDDTRRVREMLGKFSTGGNTTLTLDEFTAVLLWIIRR
jgi:hypothetical protein